MWGQRKVVSIRCRYDGGLLVLGVGPAEGCQCPVWGWPRLYMVVGARRRMCGTRTLWGRLARSSGGRKCARPVRLARRPQEAANGRHTSREHQLSDRLKATRVSPESLRYSVRNFARIMHAVDVTCHSLMIEIHILVFHLSISLGRPNHHDRTYKARLVSCCS